MNGSCTIIYGGRRNTYMVREHHVAVLPTNHINVLCMKLRVSGGSHTQYSCMISLEAQPCALVGKAVKYMKRIREF